MRTVLFALAFSAFLSSAAHAEDYTITVKNHHFEPQELIIPADQKVKITVTNTDKGGMEFESHDLKREKVIKANGKVTLLIGPLKAGSYGYFDDFHPDAKGTITVK